MSVVSKRQLTVADIIILSCLKHSVRESTKGLVFPKIIARKRGNASTIATCIASTVSLGVGCMFTENNRLLYLINAPCTVLLVLGAAEIMSRLGALFEEQNHMVSRYEDSVKNLLCDVFGCKLQSVCTMAASFIILLITYFTTNVNPFSMVFNEKCIPTVAALFSIYLLHDILKLEHSPQYVSRQIHELNGLDYGSGMAHSFFHGYLRIMLPHSGRENDKGIKEFLENYESRNGVTFDVYKLFILIPYSQHCPASLANDFSPSVEISTELEFKEVDRAGVKNRNYKNSVYKIRTYGPDKKKYVSAEYATPVKTLYEVMKQNSRCSDLYKKHRVDILLNFYLTLRELLEDDPDCRGLCELIYYDDQDDQGNYRDVGQIILSRMKQLLKKNE